VHAGLRDRIREFARRAGVAAGASDPIETLEASKLDHIVVLINMIRINKYQFSARHDTLSA
jgi:hypothetical protein